MKILFLTTVLPSARRTGGEIASQYFIDTLEKQGYQVQVLGYQRQCDTWKTAKNELAIAKRYIETKKAGLHPLFWMGTSCFKNLSFSCAKYYSQTYIQQVKKILSQTDFQIIIFDHAQMGWLADDIKSCIPKSTKVIFIAHNIEHQIYQDQSANAASYLSRYIYKRETELIKTCEDKLATLANQVWVLTENDHRYFCNLNPQTQVFNLPSRLNPVSSQPTQKNYDIGIIGTWTWKANMEGLVWFFQSVYPHLPSDISIHIAGKGGETLCKKYPNVTYRGFVADAQQFMLEAKVIAIPAIAGGGVQIKTLDAIATVVPIVGTTVAFRGISEYPAGVEIADSPQEFAHSLSQTLALNSDFDIHTTNQLLQARLAWSFHRQKDFEKNIYQAIHA